MREAGLVLEQHSFLPYNLSRPTQEATLIGQNSQRANEIDKSYKPQRSLLPIPAALVYRPPKYLSSGINNGWEMT